MTGYYARFEQVNGNRTPVALYRREAEGDASTDGILVPGGQWAPTGALAIWFLHLGDEELEEISADEADALVSKSLQGDHA